MKRCTLAQPARRHVCLRTLQQMQSPAQNVSLESNRNEI